MNANKLALGLGRFQCVLLTLVCINQSLCITFVSLTNLPPYVGANDCDPK